MSEHPIRCLGSSSGKGGGVYPFHDRSGGLRERRATWKRSSLSWTWTDQRDLL